MKKNYLVTGGTGFIGSAIVRHLVNKGFKVTVIDNNQRGSLHRLKDIRNKIKFIKVDIRDKLKIIKACKNINTIIHLAYVNGTEFFYSKPELVLDIAVKGMSNILDAAIKNKVKNFVLASSSEVYQKPNKIPTPEEVPLIVPKLSNPRFSYGGGKIICELLCQHFGKKFFKKMLIFRPHNIYGKDMGNEHVIPQLINRSKKTKKTKKLFIQGSGKETRSFTHISDFIQAFELIINKGKHLNVYNIGTSEEISIIRLTKLILGKLKIDSKIIKGKIRPGSTNKRLPNINKIKKLGYRQKVKIKDGLDEMISFY
jgi:nucleoside-diphosphate-sugar epimerase